MKPIRTGSAASARLKYFLADLDALSQRYGVSIQADSSHSYLYFHVYEENEGMQTYPYGYWTSDDNWHWDNNLRRYVQN